MSIIKDIFTVNRKTFFNPTRWLDVESIRATTLTIYNVLRSMWVVPEAGGAESFEDALKRLDLSEEEVAKRITSYRYYALIFVLAGFLSFFYGFYLIFRFHTFAGWLITTGMAALFFAQAFQYDFWAFQMSRRQLGLSFSQYKSYLLNEKGED